jgi:hypothetical protein
MAKRNAGGRMTKRRTQFEAANPERFKTAQEIIPGARNLSNHQLSRAMGWNEEGGSEPANHPMQGVLFEHPHMVDAAPRWEDLHPDHQKRVLAAAAEYGVTPDSMKRSFSAQLQRGLVRDPDHASFYSERGQNAEGHDIPRERVARSAEETGTPFHVQAAANAITSPQMAFVQVSKKGGVSYPNDETAKAAVGYAKAGMTGDEYKETFKGKYPHQGFPDNLARAIDVTRKVLGGTPLRETGWPSGAAGSGRGDKVRAYHNAWVDPKAPEGNFLVSDTHTGGGGMAPHLTKAEEGQYLSIAGIHALHDKVARDVMSEHGLGSVSRTQSLQWNQEKAEQQRKSGDNNSASMFGAESVDAMRKANPNVSTRQQAHGQQELF